MKNIFIHPKAVVVGDVALGRYCSIWPSAVIRGDLNKIVIGQYSNVQDNATIHVDLDCPTTIGSYVTIGHNAVIHGAIIGNNCLIGMGAIVLNGAVIGNNCLIGAGAVVTEGSKIPDNSLVLGLPAKVIRQLTDKEITEIKNNATGYWRLARESYLNRKRDS